MSRSHLEVKIGCVAIRASIFWVVGQRSSSFLLVTMSIATRWTLA